MNPTSPLVLLVASIFTHNIALVYILGMCPFIVISKNFKTALGMGFSLVLVVTLTAVRVTKKTTEPPIPKAV